MDTLSWVAASGHRRLVQGIVGSGALFYNHDLLRNKAYFVPLTKGVLYLGDFIGMYEQGLYRFLTCPACDYLCPIQDVAGRFADSTEFALHLHSYA